MDLVTFAEEILMENFIFCTMLTIFAKGSIISLKFPADFVIFTEETLNEKFHFLCSDIIDRKLQ